MWTWTPEAFGIFMVAMMFGTLIVAALVDMAIDAINRRRVIARRLRSIRRGS